jgi:hypothetical protein
MEVINLTPHAIKVVGKDGERVYQPSGLVARVEQSVVETGDYIDGFSVSQSVFGDIVNLPAPQPGVYYLVSAMVLGALAGSREDVVAPKTDATAIRNEKGHIVAVRGFLKY